MAIRRVSLLCGVLGVLSLGVAGCGKPSGPPPQPPPPKVRVARPALAPVQGYNSYNGYLEPVETVEVKARVKGLLTEILFEEGAEVAQGADLYRIDPREYRTAVARSQAEVAKAKADIQNQEAQVGLADIELRRLERLRGSVSPSELDEAKSKLEVTRAVLAVAKANQESAAAALQTATIQLGYTEITSPIAGRINRTLVTKGNLVGQSEPTLLTTIVSMDPVFVYFDAPERDLVEYQKQMQSRETASASGGQLPVEVGVATEDGFPHQGVIDFRENRVDTGTGTVRVRGRLPNPPSGASGARLLYPGLYAQVRVPSGPAVTRPVIPEEALMTDQTGRYVFVLTPGGQVEKRSIVVGDRVWRAPPVAESAPDGWGVLNTNPQPPEEGKPPQPIRLPLRSAVAIDQGLTAEDQVIISGLQSVRPGAPVEPQLWELRPPSARPAS